MDMKKITLEKILHVLKTGENEVQISEELRELSKRPLEKNAGIGKIGSQNRKPVGKEFKNMRIKADVVIVGTGVGGLFGALSFPREKKDRDDHKIRSGKQ